MDDRLYFRITERPDSDVFDAGWVAIDPPGLVIDRHVWRADGISRTPEGCVVLRPDPDGGWQLKNRAVGRVVILHDGRQRFDLSTGMALTLGPGLFRGSVPELFSFLLTSERPQAPLRPVRNPVRRAEPPDDVTRPRTPAMRARTYLGKHPHKRYALAMLWREHLVHTADIAEDLPTATVGLAFGVEAKVITRWREDLAENVFGERGHQGLIRDVVVKHGVMTREDVALAGRYLSDRARADRRLGS